MRHPRGRAVARVIDVKSGSRAQPRAGQREIEDDTGRGAPALLLVIEAEEKIELPVAELDGPLDTPPCEDRHDPIARPCRIEAGIVKVPAPRVGQAELGGDDCPSTSRKQGHSAPRAKSRPATDRRNARRCSVAKRFSWRRPRLASARRR